MSVRPGQTRSLVLYVVPLGDGQPDHAAQTVINAFVASGFHVLSHAERVDEAVVGARATAAHAAAILLCPSEQEDLAPFRPLVARIRASNGDPGSIFDVLAVRRVIPEEIREGDRTAPFLTHPDEGESRMLWLAQFVARSAAFVGPMKPPERQ